MSDYPKSEYAERPAPPPLPKHLEAELKERGIYGRDFGTMPAQELFPDIKASSMDSLYAGNPEFDWQGLFDQMGEAGPQRDEALGLAAQAFRQILQWAVSTQLNRRDSLRTIGKRVLCAAWVIDPEFFAGQSLSKIAKELGFGASAISPLTAEFSRNFKMTNRNQSHNRREHQPPRNKGGQNEPPT